MASNLPGTSAQKDHCDRNPDEGRPKNKFEVRDEESDIVLVVDGKNLYASKSILAIRSPVFQAMFRHDFKEKHSKRITLETTKYDAMVNLLEQIYPGRGDELIKGEA